MHIAGRGGRWYTAGAKLGAKTSARRNVCGLKMRSVKNSWTVEPLHRVARIYGDDLAAASQHVGQ